MDRITYTKNDSDPRRFFPAVTSGPYPQETKQTLAWLISYAEATRQAGLVWGGDFRTIYDPGHIQLGEIATTALHRAYTQGTSTLAELLK